MYVCICIYIYMTYIYEYVNIRTVFNNILTNVSVFKNVRTYINKYTYTYTHIYIYI